jgi:phosphoglycolate phosphatase
MTALFFANIREYNTKESNMEANKGYTHVIWDFNGTILDDVAHGIDCVNVMLEKRGLPILPDKTAYRKAFGFPIDEYYRRLGFDFEKEDYDTVLAPEWVALYLAGEAGCPLMEGVRETMDAIRALGIRQTVLSASKLDQLTAQLERLGLEEVFEEIIGLDNIHARSKREQALDWKRRHPHARPLFVGDTEHDADVAASVGGDCLLYTGGHQPVEKLAGRGVPLIGSIREILRYL